MAKAATTYPLATIRRRLDLWGLGLVTAAVVFYVVQNAWLKIGGDIAFVKVLWLMTALYFWYVLPPALARHPQAPKYLGLIYLLFWGNMIGRAVIELYLMYGPKSWHPHMGIGHNIFSMVLITTMALWWQRELGRHSVLRWHLWVTVAMFAIETYFAWYMLHNVQAQGPVYYVPADGSHNTILFVTGAVIAVLAAYYLFVLRRLWPKGQRAG